MRRAISRILDNIGSISLALVLAVTIWVVALYQENPPVIGVFEGIPIEVLNVPEGMIILGGVEKEAKVEVRAPRRSWEKLRSNKFLASVDLSGMSAGMHDVEVQVTCSDKDVEILNVEPSEMSIRLEEFKEREMDVEVRTVGRPAVGYLSKEPVAIPSNVMVSGPSSLVDKVAMVVAQVNLRDARRDVRRYVSLFPKNAKGDLIKGIELNPSTVEVRVPVEQKIGYKEVSVRAILSGTEAPGYWISDISVEPSTVTVKGSPEAISEMGGYLETVPLDISGASSDVVEKVALVAPEGISILWEGGVLVKVIITPEFGGKTVQRGLSVQGLSSGLSARLSPEVVDVILSGPLPKLEALKPEDVKVVLDLFGLKQGVHKVKPTAIVPEGITVKSILPERIEVEITTSPTPTPEATETPTPTPLPPTPTPTPTPQIPPKCPNPKARITYPTVNAILIGKVEILGSANIEGFDYYKFEFKREGALEWSFLERFEEPVEDGVLGVWDTSLLQSGVYLFRLVVVDTSGNYPEPCEVRVIVRR
jgi:YbbR domain-containing protein